MVKRTRSEVLSVPLARAVTTWRRYREIRKKNKVRAFYGQFIGAGDLCFDIGANIGKKLAVFLDLGARVVAVEPVPNLCRVLEKKFAVNPEFKLVQAGISQDGKPATLYVHNSHSELTTLCQRWVAELPNLNPEVSNSWTKYAGVATITLDRLISQFGTPDFCKIDVEGFEDKVFAGLSRPLPKICFEALPFFGQPAAIALERLKYLGNYRCNYTLDESRGWGMKHWVDINRMSEVFASMRKLGEPACDIHAHQVEGANHVP